jgi:hypothetical protein
MSLTKVTFSMIDSTPINAKDYGVDMTGVADSSAAFQLALNACAGGKLSATGSAEMYSVLRLFPDLLASDGLATSIVGAGVFRLPTSGLDSLVKSDPHCLHF